MNRVTVLAETPLLRVSRFDHPEEEPHEDPGEEHSPWLSLSFVLRGSFSIALGSRTYPFSPRDLFVARPGVTYRTIHAERVPSDACLSLEYAPTFFGGEPAPGSPPRVEPTNRSAYLRLRLERAVAAGAGGLELETIAAALLKAVERPSTRGALYREGSLAWYVERIESARSRMESSPAGEHTLGSLSRHAGMSPFHFARLFRELTGIPPGRYLLHARLSRAHALLKEGRSVTDTCFDCGFRSLSYFSRAFRKRYGVRPSDVLRPRN